MLYPLAIFYWIGAASSLIVFAGFAIVSLLEGEPRATRVSALAALAGTMLFALAAQLPQSAQIGIFFGTVMLALTGLIAFLIPVGEVDLTRDAPSKRMDERNIVFARYNLVPGSPEHRAYYSRWPEDKAKDDLTRSKPGLLSLRATHADGLLFSASQGSFSVTGALRGLVDGPVSKEKIELSPAKMTDFVKSLSRYYGALEVGVTKLQPYHVYSHVGRGPYSYGEPITLYHRYAIAITVEMDHKMVGAGPAAATVVESAHQYVEAARAAVQVAEAIRGWGYAARAHIDGDYRVICPLVARDAGLGEIGRMGILITPRHGPRVRLAVVTTELELIPDRRKKDASVIDFCTICEKCADNCPVRAIPFGERGEIDGTLRWRINPDTCFRYWNVVGTDCGRCLSVCPYSHPNSGFHNLVRWGSARSGGFRRLALWLDDLFYGKRPAPRRPPAWTSPGGSVK